MDRGAIVTPTIVVHGGCGTPADKTIADEPSYHAALAEAVEAAERSLTRGGAALDAAQAAVESLEDAPQFNAGGGWLLPPEGFVERDAGLWSGARAGAVAAVETVRHPVALARVVMEA